MTSPEQAPAADSENALRRRIDDLEAKLRFALHEISDLRQLTRMLLAESPSYRQVSQQTLDSFQHQWADLPSGLGMVGDPDFDRQAIGHVERYTGLPAEWFKGKTALDAGCGNGRWSLTLCRMGARVTAIDNSDAGVANVRRLCAEHEGFRAERRNLLEPLGLDGAFDFVWCFGVVHHTGDTARALANVARAVREGGTLFLMIYGEPRHNRPEDFGELNSYIALRREMEAMTFEEKVAFLKARHPEDHVHPWFDAVGPKINDLHRFGEIREWLRDLGFDDVRRTVDNRNHILTARRVAA